MAAQVPAAGSPRFELTDSDNLNEDSEPMMRGQTLSTGLTDAFVPDAATTQPTNPAKENEKTRASAFVSYFRNKNAAAAAVEGGKAKPAPKEKFNPLVSRFKKDWTKEQQALTKLKTSAAGTLSSVGRGAAEGGAFLLEASRKTAHATAESFRKLKIFGTPLGTLCKAECNARPCPRALLVCCTSIVSNGLEVENLFKEEAPKELVDALSDHLYLGNGAVLPPHGASPQVLASVVKHFLQSLPEPLLTYRLVPEWISAGTEPLRGRMLMAQLPPVNMNALDIILDMCHRISGNSAINDMDPRSLAEALVPCLIWKQHSERIPASKAPAPLVHRLFGGNQTNTISGSDDEIIQLNDPDMASTPAKSDASNPATVSLNKMAKVPLDAGEMEAVIHIIAYMISEYRTI